MFRLSGWFDVIYFFGVVEKSGVYCYLLGVVYIIVNFVKYSVGVDNSIVYVIDLMGNVYLKGVVYWNVDYV